MHLGHLIVDPARRGRGMGRALTELTVREDFRATALPAMTVGVYQSLGFHKTGHVEHREVDGEVWDVLKGNSPALTSTTEPAIPGADGKRSHQCPQKNALPLTRSLRTTTIAPGA